MEYILLLIPAAPVLTAMAAVLYAGIFLFARKKRKRKLSVRKILGEFLLTGWFLTYLYVTQKLSNEIGLGRSVNLKPFHPFIIAVKYGLSNFEMVKVILLNTIMVLPLGFLLPIVFDRRMKNYLSIFLVAFPVAVLTELSQFLTQRSADIDDVISNTMGALLGFALYVLYCGLRHLVKRRSIPTGLRWYWLQFLFALGFIGLSVGPFIALNVYYGTSEYGYMSYDHLKPASFSVSSIVGRYETTSMVYQYEPRENEEEIKTRLQEVTTFSGKFKGDTLKSGESREIIIDRHNRWRVVYREPEEEADISSIPSEVDALEAARTCLKSFGILEEIKYTKAEHDKENGTIRLNFTDKGRIKGALVDGSVTVVIGEDSLPLSVEDTRIYCRPYRRVVTISPYQSILVAREVAVGEWPGFAYVYNVTPSHYFNEETDFLIPTWKIQASFISSDGEEYSWTPNIDAVK